MTQNRTDRWVSNKRNRLYLILGSFLVVALCVAVRYAWGPATASADTPAKTSAKAKPASNRSPAELPEQTIVATVNTQRITRGELGLQCRQTYGAEVLESMVNRHLISQECHRLGIDVTRAEVTAEIERMAKRFNIPVDQYLKLLKQERNLTSEQYANDIVWPMLALRKIAGERLTIERDELLKEFDVEYGEAVRARLIAVNTLDKANKLHAQAVANPDDFGNLAKDYSEDAPSASAKGMINPIRKHGSYQEIEDAVFNMEDGAITPVIHAGGQYVILKREGLMAAQPVKFEQVAPRLEEVLRDRKMKAVAPEIFKQLQKDAVVENIWNDPVKHQQAPEVAATINGQPITIRQLDEECIARHGLVTLEGMISRKLLELECKRRNVKIVDSDLDAEIARTALVNVKPKADGSPDVKAWLDLVTEKLGVSTATYRNNVVWMTVALKKLVGNRVEITDDDLQKGFEANFGPRVRCLAVVLNNQRRAQQVFDMARKNNTSEYFGQLAAEYSVEPGSQAMNGEVPPIKKHGGQPKLEEEAFQLKPGEISGIIQVGDKFVILRCEGLEKASNVEFETVRQEIYDDLLEKKLQIAMGEEFEKLQQAATIDNYLAGTSRSPAEKEGGVLPEARIPTLKEVEGK